MPNGLIQVKWSDFDNTDLLESSMNKPISWKHIKDVKPDLVINISVSKCLFSPTPEIFE